jgi:hypothetical protein
LEGLGVVETYTQRKSPRRNELIMISIKYDYIDSTGRHEGWFHFHGTIDATPTIRYQFEKKNPYLLNTFYRSEPFYTDTLNIRLAITDSEYADVYHAVMNSKKATIVWRNNGGLQWRTCRPALPYPSKLRNMNGRVEFRIETDAYREIQFDMRNVEILNTIWNAETINTTFWKGTIT